MADPAARIEELSRELDRHNHLYYVEASPEISDQRYDKLLKELEALEAANPSLARPDSPSQRVGGAPVAGLKTVVHKVPMLSIGNAYNVGELRDFDTKVKKELGAGQGPLRRRAEDRRRERRPHLPRRRAGDGGDARRRRARRRRDAHDQDGRRAAAAARVRARASGGARRGVHHQGRLRRPQRRPEGARREGGGQPPQPRRRHGAHARPQGGGHAQAARLRLLGRPCRRPGVQEAGGDPGSAQGLRLPRRAGHRVVRRHRGRGQVLRRLGGAALRPALRHRRPGHQGGRPEGPREAQVHGQARQVGHRPQVRGRAGDHQAAGHRDPRRQVWRADAGGELRDGASVPDQREQRHPAQRRPGAREGHPGGRYHHRGEEGRDHPLRRRRAQGDAHRRGEAVRLPQELPERAGRR